jgi:hypothetical protein
MNRYQRTRLTQFLVGFAALIGLSLAYDAWLPTVSTTRATLTGRYTKCGPITNSGPRETPGLRGHKRYMLMARLDDGRLIRVDRKANHFPPCGATLTIEERLTPWGSVWYWTEQ